MLSRFPVGIANLPDVLLTVRQHDESKSARERGQLSHCSRTLRRRAAWRLHLQYSSPNTTTAASVLAEAEAVAKDPPASAFTESSLPSDECVKLEDTSTVAPMSEGDREAVNPDRCVREGGGQAFGLDVGEAEFGLLFEVLQQPDLVVSATQASQACALLRHLLSCYISSLSDVIVVEPMIEMLLHNSVSLLTRRVLARAATKFGIAQLEDACRAAEIRPTELLREAVSMFLVP